MLQAGEQQSCRPSPTATSRSRQSRSASSIAPVSVAFDGDRAFFRSYDKAWKTKRLRNNPNVEVAPATFRASKPGPGARARAVLLTGAQAQVATKTLARRHRVVQAVLVPLAHRIMRYRTMHYVLKPPDPAVR